MASARRGGTQNGVTMAGVAPAEHDRDSEYLEKRREFLSQFFGTGPGGVSPSAYTAGLAAAGVLPQAPLLQNGRFRSPDAPKDRGYGPVPLLKRLFLPAPMGESYGGI